MIIPYCPDCTKVNIINIFLAQAEKHYSACAKFHANANLPVVSGKAFLGNAA